MAYLVTSLAAMMIFLAACGGDQENPPEPSTAADAPSSESPREPSSETTAATAPYADLIPGGPEDDCGMVLFDGTAYNILLVRGTSCAEAPPVARAYLRDQTPPPPWRCELDAEHGFNALACGYGSGGKVRNAKHAFIGRIEGD